MTTTAVTVALAPAAPRVAATRRHRRPAPNRRARAGVVAKAVEIEPDGVLDDMPEGAPSPPAPEPIAARTVARAPLACPVSLQALEDAGYSRCNGLRYGKTDCIWDLTIGAATNARSSEPVSLQDLARSFLPPELRGLIPTSSYLGTSTFETPQVAFAYERGWRDSFARAGFPGPDEEFRLAQARLTPFATGKCVVDASCGSGLFTRRFVKSGDYGCVVALDFSDAMLRQARTFASEEGLVDASSTDEATFINQEDGLLFVRADIARIPMTSDSVGGVHAGAAIHCWPQPREAVAEIARVLEPGGAFCGTTFLTPQLPFADDETQQRVDAAMRELQTAVVGRAGGTRGFRQWNKKDLRDLCVECGLVDFECDVRGGFIFFSARKPAPVA